MYHKIMHITDHNCLFLWTYSSTTHLDVSLNEGVVVLDGMHGHVTHEAYNIIFAFIYMILKL